MEIKKLKIEYKEQNNRCTAYPIFVTVQEKICIGVMDENCSVLCPYGDGINEYSYSHEDLEEDYDDIDDCFKALQNEIGSHEAESERLNIKENNMGYIWKDVEWFLTVKGAKEYINLNRHNLGKTRTYVHHFSRRNFEMRELLKDIGFKT